MIAEELKRYIVAVDRHENLAAGTNTLLIAVAKFVAERLPDPPKPRAIDDDGLKLLRMAANVLYNLNQSLQFDSFDRAKYRDLCDTLVADIDAYMKARQ